MPDEIKTNATSQLRMRGEIGGADLADDLRPRLGRNEQRLQRHTFVTPDTLGGPAS